MAFIQVLVLILIGLPLAFVAVSSINSGITNKFMAYPEIKLTEAAVTDVANAAIEASEESSLELSEVTVKLDKVEQDEDSRFVTQPFTVSVKETGEILDTNEVTIPKTSRMTVSPQGDGASESKRRAGSTKTSTIRGVPLTLLTKFLR